MGLSYLHALVEHGSPFNTPLSIRSLLRFPSSEVSVFWIHAATAERFRKASRDIAKEVDISDWQDPQADAWQVLKEWFESERSGKWLIILDNADDIDVLYAPSSGRFPDCFPRSDHGSILMTTRNKQIGIKFVTAKNIVDLPAMTDIESSMLLTAMLGEGQLDHRERIKLAEALEGIPLALIQVISYISENGMTVAHLPGII